MKKTRQVLVASLNDYGKPFVNGKWVIVFFVLLSLISVGCKKEKKTNVDPIDSAVPVSMLLDSDGTTFKLLLDGRLFKKVKGSSIWEFVEQYYEADFLTKNYEFNSNGIFHKTETGELVPVQRQWTDNFQGYLYFNDLFKKSAGDSRNWTDFTAQSPLAKTVSEYVALRSCILDNTCTFLDNSMELYPGFTPGDTCMKFNSVAPSSDMVTAKSSIESTLLFFEKGDDIWYEADYYITQYPLTLVDFECKWFSLSPGPRIIFLDGNVVAMELKFGNKPIYKQPEASKITFPANQWVRLKVHIKLQDETNGIIQVWQDGVLIIDTTGQTLPTSNCIITNLEVGISATSQIAELYINNLRLSDSSF